MPALNLGLVRRDMGDAPSSTMINLMIAVLTLLFFALLLVAILFLVRRLRMQQQMRAQMLPNYGADSMQQHGHQRSSGRNHRRLTITTSEDRSSRVVVIRQDARPMLINPDRPPHSPDNIPQIHITFPDEHDDKGNKRASGRVVVVKVGEKSIGMEPLREHHQPASPSSEQLPAYNEKETNDGFFSLDLDHIGGLKEKERINFK